MIIEKRKKGEEKWEEIDLASMVRDIDEYWTLQILQGKIEVEKMPTESKILYVALYISLHRKYETAEAEYRII